MNKKLTINTINEILMKCIPAKKKKRTVRNINIREEGKRIALE